MPELDPTIRSQTFDEVSQGYSAEEAVNEALRCIHCPSKPCVSGCPVGVPISDLPDREVGEGNFGRAYAVVKRKPTRFPAICGRVCPQENQCEGVCTRGKNGEPVGIGRLERFVADWAFANPEQAAAALEEYRSGSECATGHDLSGKRVAVVGSGPASLTCAGELAKCHAEVTGVRGIASGGRRAHLRRLPEFRLPKDLVAKEVSAIADLGVSFEVNALVGKLYDIDELMGEMGFVCRIRRYGCGASFVSGHRGRGA